MRGLLVITLLLQSLVAFAPTRTVDVLASGGPCVCATTCCCGGAASAHCAPKPANACMCNADSDLPRRGPTAPPPRVGNDTAFLALRPTAVVVKLSDPARHALRPTTQASPYASRNEAQALLCVWRT